LRRPPEIRAHIRGALESPGEPRAVAAVELLIRSTHGEYYVKRFDKISAALGYLSGLVADRPVLPRLTR